MDGDELIKLLGVCYGDINSDDNSDDDGDELAHNDEHSEPLRDGVRDGDKIALQLRVDDGVCFADDDDHGVDNDEQLAVVERIRVVHSLGLGFIDELQHELVHDFAEPSGDAEYHVRALAVVH